MWFKKHKDTFRKSGPVFDFSLVLFCPASQRGLVLGLAAAQRRGEEILEFMNQYFQKRRLRRRPFDFLLGAYLSR